MLPLEDGSRHQHVSVLTQLWAPSRFIGCWPFSLFLSPLMSRSLPLAAFLRRTHTFCVSIRETWPFFASRAERYLRTAGGEDTHKKQLKINRDCHIIQLFPFLELLYFVFLMGLFGQETEPLYSVSVLGEMQRG